MCWGDTIARAMKELFRGMQMFCVLIVVVFIWVNTFVKLIERIHLKQVPFIILKFLRCLKESSPPKFKIK